MTFSVALVTIGLAQPPDETSVTFPDANLEAAITEAIDKATGDITPSDLAALTSLDASESKITNLVGLQYCTNLTYLEVQENDIVNISPLAGLTNLTTLNLHSNQISDVSPLLSLPSLKTLSVRYGNPLSEISLKVYIPQLKTGGASISRPKTTIGMGSSGLLFIPPFVCLAALVIVLLGYDTYGLRGKMLRKAGLIVGVIVTGLYTFGALFVVAFDAIYLEDLLLFVVAPGLFLYGSMAVAWFLWSRKEQKEKRKNMRSNSRRVFLDR